MELCTRDRIRPDIQQYYEIASSQHTIHHDGSYSGILSDAGLAEFDRLQKFVDQNDVAGVIYNYTLELAESGSWVANPESPFPSECVACMNTYNNLRVRGSLPDENFKFAIVTSPLIYYTDAWCYTRTGSLYKLINRVE